MKQTNSSGNKLLATITKQSSTAVPNNQPDRGWWNESRSVPGQHGVNEKTGSAKERDPRQTKKRRIPEEFFGTETVGVGRRWSVAVPDFEAGGTAGAGSPSRKFRKRVLSLDTSGVLWPNPVLLLLQLHKMIDHSMIRNYLALDDMFVPTLDPPNANQAALFLSENDDESSMETNPSLSTEN